MSLTPAWDATFTLLSIGAVLLVGIFALVARRGTGNYLGDCVSRSRQRRDDDASRSSMVVRFILEVERNLLALLRGNRPASGHADRAADRLLRHQRFRGVGHLRGDRRAHRDGRGAGHRDVRAPGQRGRRDRTGQPRNAGSVAHRDRNGAGALGWWSAGAGPAAARAAVGGAGAGALSAPWHDEGERGYASPADAQCLLAPLRGAFSYRTRR